jgi:CRISPR-associated protein Cmr2
MTAYLLAINIGPVQDFIAAARRTRDLWFGSHMLSEVSKAAALAIQKAPGMGALIFPAPKSETDLQPTLDGEDPILVAANVILAYVPEGEDPRSISAQAKSAAEARWLDFAETAHRKAQDKVHEDIWKDQLDDVIEFYSAWVPFASGSDYVQARTHVMRLLAARKACRDFRQPKLDPERRRISKSSLDGARETVLRKGTKGSDSLRLARGEQLDAIGLTKRLAGGVQYFPSVARIAADPWLRHLDDSPEHKMQFQQLKEECQKLGSGISRVKENKFSDFPFEGTAVYLSRHPSIAEEAGHKRQLSELTQIVKDLIKPESEGGIGKPDPYLGIIAADGDRIGKFLSQLKTPEEHRNFSRWLSAFSDEARRIIHNSRGVCIYAGGDDILAIVPLDYCLECARLLCHQFKNSLCDFAETPATLSVGIAVAHFMEPLEDLRAFAKQAEMAAKKATPNTLGSLQFDERNGLAVQVHPRGGVFYGVREQWQKGDSSLDKRLHRWAKLFQSRSLPNKLPYDLRELTCAYKSWSRTDSLAAALQADCRRLLRHKQVKLETEDRDWTEEQLHRAADADGILRLSAELLVAQKLPAQCGWRRKKEVVR